MAALSSAILRWGSSRIAVGATIYQQHLLAGRPWSSSPCLSESRARCITRYSLTSLGREGQGLPGWADAVGASCRTRYACQWRGESSLGQGRARSLLCKAAMRSPASGEPHSPNACGIIPAAGFSLQLRAPGAALRLRTEVPGPPVALSGLTGVFLGALTQRQPSRA